MGTVVSIHRIASKGGAALALDEARFVADFGLVGDWRSRSGRGRQITLIEEEGLEAAARALGRGPVASGASRRQVVTRGIALGEAVGRRLRVGELLVLVEELCDPCSNMERRIGAGAREALQDRPGVCGRVIEGGVLRPGDPVLAEG